MISESPEKVLSDGMFSSNFPIPISIDLPEDIAQRLDEKLRKLDDVLQQEVCVCVCGVFSVHCVPQVEVIEKQQHKIVTGELGNLTINRVSCLHARQLHV